MKRKKAGVVILCAAVLIAGIFAAVSSRNGKAADLDSVEVNHSMKVLEEILLSMEDAVENH